MNAAIILHRLKGDSGLSTINIDEACEERKPGVNFAKIETCQDIGTQV